MTIRKIIEINEELCNGCGQCVVGCPEGAIKIENGKARLANDTYCDGLGACIGDCPVGAIKVVEREAGAYDERTVIANIAKKGEQAVKDHLEHLREHGEHEYLKQAMAFLASQGPAQGASDSRHGHVFTQVPKSHGCPGSAARSFTPKELQPTGEMTFKQKSALTHWPVQMHLINPNSPHFCGSDFVLAADCVAFSLGDFHGSHLRGKTLGIACPKLDRGHDIYLNKLRTLIDDAKVNTLTVMIMQVPCCRGLLELAKQAVSESARKVPLKAIVVGIEGDILSSDWI